MKRLIAALLTLALCAGHSEAKVLIISKNAPTIDNGLGYATEQGAYEMMMRRGLGQLTAILDAYGVDYKIAPAGVAKTEFCRTGNFVWNYGTANPVVESFDAVIHWGGTAAPPSVTGYRPDSLATSAKAAQVPQLIIYPPGLGLTTAGVQASTSLGLEGGAAEGGAYPRLLTDASGNLRWWSSANVQNFIVGSTSQGMRPLVRVRHSALHHTATSGGGTFATNTSGVICGTCDSVAYDVSADHDTLVAWEIPNTGSAGAKSVIVCQFYGASACSDSTGGVLNPCEGEVTQLLLCLARLDSLSGGNVFSSAAIPKRAGIIIEGGFNRSGRRHPGGIYPSDTTVFKASLDSLARLNPSPPLAVTVDLDSVRTYASEKAWWAKLPNVRYIPFTRLGQDSGAAGFGAWSFTRPVDPFGRYRSRFFLGPDSSFRASGGAYVVNNADSSLTAGVRSLLFRADSTFGRARVSRFLVAPDDDWSPKNMLWTANAWDSLVYSLQRAGVTGVLADAQRPEANPGLIAPGNRDLLRGWVTNQGYYRSSLGGMPIKVLAHSGYPIMASTGLYMLRDRFAGASYVADTIPPYSITTGSGGGTVMQITNYEMSRFWNQLFMNNYRDVDYWPTDIQHDAYDDVVTPKVDKFYNIQHGSIYKLHANDFGGDATLPARPGYWLVKSIWQCMQAINNAAGRTVITLDYPDAIRP